MRRVAARRIFLLALVLVTARVAFLRDAAAGDARAGFHVKVQISGSAHAASIAKAAGHAASPSGMPALNQLRFGVTTRAGYFVRFQIEDPAVEFVDIRGLGGEMRIVSGAKDVFVPPSGQGQVVTYTVKVRPGEVLSVAPPVRATIVP